MNCQEYRGAVQARRDRAGKGKTHLELNVVRNCGQQQGHLQVYQLQKEDEGKCEPAAEWGRGPGNKKAEALVFYWQGQPSGTSCPETCEKIWSKGKKIKLRNI